MLCCTTTRATTVLFLVSVFVPEVEGACVRSSEGRRRTETPLKFDFPVDSIARSRQAVEQLAGQIDPLSTSGSSAIRSSATAMIRKAMCSSFDSVCPDLRAVATNTDFFREAVHTYGPRP